MHHSLGAWTPSGKEPTSYHTVAAALVMQSHDDAAHELGHCEQLLQGGPSCFALFARFACFLGTLGALELLCHHV